MKAKSFQNQNSPQHRTSRHLHYIVPTIIKPFCSSTSSPTTFTLAIFSPHYLFIPPIHQHLPPPLHIPPTNFMFDQPTLPCHKIEKTLNHHHQLKKTPIHPTTPITSTNFRCLYGSVCGAWRNVIPLRIQLEMVDEGFH